MYPRVFVSGPVWPDIWNVMGGSSVVVAGRLKGASGFPKTASGSADAPLEAFLRQPEVVPCDQPDDDERSFLRRLPQPFSAPSVVPMMRLWKKKNSTATGMVIRTAAASFSGNWLPEPS